MHLIVTSLTTAKWIKCTIGVFNLFPALVRPDWWLTVCRVIWKPPKGIFCSFWLCIGEGLKIKLPSAVTHSTFPKIDICMIPMWPQASGSHVTQLSMGDTSLLKTDTFGQKSVCLFVFYIYINTFHDLAFKCWNVLREGKSRYRCSYLAALH